VGMPAHFIVSYEGEDERIFVDAFNGGKKLGKKECVEFLSRTGFGYVEEYLEPVSNLDILSRFMRNLINVYSKKQSPDRVQELRRYLAILNQRY
jgi:regulator of sirC expression with transglutaminase-like and TPR domain